MAKKDLILFAFIFAFIGSIMFYGHVVIDRQNEIAEESRQCIEVMP